MRVVHLSYYYGNNISGAPIAASRLHNALLRNGIYSHFVCVDERVQGTNVHKVPQLKILSRIWYFFTRGVWVLSRIVFGRILMTNLFPLPGFCREIKKIDPDIIHVHFISQDMVSFAQLASLHIPLVFSLHDLFIVNAVEPYPGKDTRFIHGFMPSNSSAVERWLWKRKKRFVDRCEICFTGPSNWVCASLRDSIIGKKHDAVLIPNLLDPVFGYDPDKCIAHEKFAVLFGAFNGRRSPLKGWADLVKALKVLPTEIKSSIEVFVFGEMAQNYFEENVRVCFVGPIENPASLRDLHHKVDVFALPSKQDNAPQVKFEALVDGLPVVAFQRTGCAEYLKNGVNGWVAPDGDYHEYANGIMYFIDLFRSGKLDALRQKISDEAKTLFSEDRIVDQYLKFYENCLKQ